MVIELLIGQGIALTIEIGDRWCSLKIFLRQLISSTIGCRNLFDIGECCIK